MSAVDSLLAVQDVTASKALFSDLLYPMVTKYGSTFEKIQLYDGMIDLTNLDATMQAISTRDITSSDLKGLQYLKNIKWLNLGTDTRFPNLLDITGFTNLELLKARDFSSSVSTLKGDMTGMTKLRHIDLGGINIMGDLSNLTALEYCKLQCVTAGGPFWGGRSTAYSTAGPSPKRPTELTLPIPGNNPNLTYYEVGPITKAWSTTADIGPLRNCLKLISFLASNMYSSYTETTTSPIVGDYILAELLIAKQAGSSLSTVNISNMPVTNGNAGNASAIALRNLGVTVTAKA